MCLPMTRMRLFSLVAVLVVVGLVAAAIGTARVATAQTGGGYDLTWSTVDGGGGSSSGGEFTVDGTVGQHDAGTLSGGTYALAGGFWSGVTGGVTAVMNSLFLPLIIR
jgi:hypothetical protein